MVNPVGVGYQPILNNGLGRRPANFGRCSTGSDIHLQRRPTFLLLNFRSDESRVVNPVGVGYQPNQRNDLGRRLANFGRCSTGSDVHSRFAKTWDFRVVLFWIRRVACGPPSECKISA